MASARRNLIVALAGFLAQATPALAHDFWLQPAVFHVKPGQPVPLRILIGDPAAVEHWETEWRKIVSFQDFGPDTVTDQLATIVPLNGAKPSIDRQDAVVRLHAPGTHMLAFTSNQTLSDLPAAQFNPYVAHEGLALPLAKRMADGTTAANGRELYSRRAKVLVQVGRVATSRVTRPIGQTLEIVPARNPYALKPGEPLRLRIWFHGAPLPGASVVLERLGEGATHGTPVVSDSHGDVVFLIDRGGQWKANVVWSYPITDPRADYETIFCSMTFGGPDPVRR
ncbi:DUF4198 domain-containing protein [Novosphingobium sp.]|uniref:DUF4198 domain-containing protein n=1 Tax=Novosphingobium sp. TaxID=1874826 RepID=UPI0025E1ABD4|nr:DUF4198 domain-containing protein [Novosphingobium sp.]